MKTPDIPIGTDRPPIEDSMSAIQALEDERATQEWLAKQRPPKQVDPELQLFAEQLFPLDVTIGQLLILLRAAGPERVRELGFDSVLATDLRGLSVEQRLRQLRRDLRAVKVECPICDIAPDEDDRESA